MFSRFPEWLSRAVWLATPILIFLCFFNPAVLDPTNISWLFQKDWGQHVLGWHALRHNDGSFNHQDLLAHPTGLSIIYTDSNPLFALPLKLISGILPANFQYIGPWFLLCVCAHFYLAYRLLQRHAPSGWQAWVGALLLTLVPALFERIRHDTLVGQFLILWALYIYFEIGTARRRNLFWGLLLAITGLIHPYLMVMLLAIWAGDQLRNVWGPMLARDGRAIAIVVGEAALTLVPPLFTMWLCGTFGSSNSAGSVGYGFYSMGLDAPFNPSRPDFLFGGKVSVEQPLGQVMEGFQYMGLGLLALIGIALWQVRKTEAAVRSHLKPAVFLILPFVGLFLLAITHKVQIYGHPLLTLNLPPFVLEPLGIMRASGRMFWPIAYFLVLAAVLILFQSRMRFAKYVLPVVLAVQILDMAPFSASIRAETAMAADRDIYQQIPSKQWDELIQAADLVSFQPANAHINKRMFYEMSWRAASHGVPINTMYATRPNPTQAFIEYSERERFRKGELAARHLYVFFNPCDAPEGARSRLRELDGIFILPAEATTGLVPTVPKVPRVELGKAYDFGWASQGSCYLQDNWLMPERLAVTSRVNADVSLDVPLATVPRRETTLTLTVMATRDETPVSVEINGRPVTHVLLTKKPQEVRVAVPARWLRKGRMHVALKHVADTVPVPASLSTAPVEAPVAKPAAARLRLYWLRLDPKSPDSRPARSATQL